MAAKKTNVNTVKIPKPKRKPCEPPSSQKKHKNHRRCKWQFNTVCLCYIDEEAYKKGYALYRDRNDVSDEECKKWFMPINDALESGEQHFCRRESAFVEVATAKVAKRVRSKKTGKVEGYAPILFGESSENLSLVARPEGGQEY